MNDPINDVLLMQTSSKKRPPWLSQRMLEIILVVLGLGGTGAGGIATLSSDIKDLTSQMQAMQIRIAVLETRLSMGRSDRER